MVSEGLASLAWGRGQDRTREELTCCLAFPGLWVTGISTEALEGLVSLSLVGLASLSWKGLALAGLRPLVGEAAFLSFRGLRSLSLGGGRGDQGLF